MESEAGDTVYWYKIMYHQYFFCILILNHLNKNKSNICPKQTFWFGEEMQSIWLTKLSWIYTRPLKMVKLRGDHFHLKISSGGENWCFTSSQQQSYIMARPPALYRIFYGM